MADRLDYYFRQQFTKAQLDLACELLEKADRNLAADIGVYGIISGAEPTPHSPVPDLTIDPTAPGRAYDNLGQRIFFGTGQVVDCAVDFAGISRAFALRWRSTVRAGSVGDRGPAHALDHGFEEQVVELGAVRDPFGIRTPYDNGPAGGPARPL